MQFIKIETAVSDVWVNKDHIVSLNPRTEPVRVTILRLVNGDQFASTQTVEEILAATAAPAAPEDRQAWQQRGAEALQRAFPTLFDDFTEAWFIKAAGIVINASTGGER